jgi:hypothetical protein
MATVRGAASVLAAVAAGAVTGVGVTLAYFPGAPPAPPQGAVTRASRPADRGAAAARALEQARTLHAARSAAPELSRRMQSEVSERLRRLSPGLPLAGMRALCRTTSCMVEVQWASRAAATAHAQQLLERSALIPCSRTHILPRESAGPGPYASVLHFDCESPL